jgi:hypothetical protein
MKTQAGIHKLRWFMIFFLFISVDYLLSAQNMFISQYEYQADLKVYVVPYEYQCDLKVYKVSYEYQAKRAGLWYFVPYEYQADCRIYNVKYEYQADLKIFYVEYEYQSGWRDPGKSIILFKRKR